MWGSGHHGHHGHHHGHHGHQNQGTIALIQAVSVSASILEVAKDSIKDLTKIKDLASTVGEDRIKTTIR